MIGGAVAANIQCSSVGRTQSSDAGEDCMDYEREIYMPSQSVKASNVDNIKWQAARQAHAYLSICMLAANDNQNQ